MIREMDGWLHNYANLAKKQYDKADPEYPGAGAAGGLGFAFLTFTNAVLESGIQIILEETKLESYIQSADVVITGEGRLDGQTAMEKPRLAWQKWRKKIWETSYRICGQCYTGCRSVQSKRHRCIFSHPQKNSNFTGGHEPAKCTKQYGGHSRTSNALMEYFFQLKIS